MSDCLGDLLYYSADADYRTTRSWAVPAAQAMGAACVTRILRSLGNSHTLTICLRWFPISPNTEINARFRHPWLRPVAGG